jgi:hypothetical protein
VPHIPDSRHTDHDPLAIAAYAAGDVTGTELELARDLVASCADCAALHADLRAISAALPDLPAPARSRDFTLTPEQAASLRPSGWRRLLAPLAGPRFAFAGPLGGGLATLGIAGLLVAGSLGAPVAGTTPGADDGGTGAAPQELATGIQGTGPAEPDPSDGALTYKDPNASAAPSGPVEQLTGPVNPAPAPSGDPDVMTGMAVSPAPESPVDTSRAMDAPAAASPPMLLPVLSIASLVIGVVLGGLWLVGRRVRPAG